MGEGHEQVFPVELLQDISEHTNPDLEDKVNSQGGCNDTESYELSPNNQGQGRAHVAFDPGKVETNKHEAGSVRRSNRARHEPKWLRDFEHKRSTRGKKES